MSALGTGDVLMLAGWDRRTRSMSHTTIAR
jgi:hypothetical protein